MTVYLLLVLIRPQDYPELVDKIGLPLQPLALLLAAGFWMLSPRKSFDAPQYPLLLAFFGVLMFSHVFNGWIGGALEQLEKFAPTLLAFVVFANALENRRRIVGAMMIFSLSSAVLALHGIGQIDDGIGWTGMGLSQGTRIQYVGIFNDPNDLGMLFVTCLPMAVFLASRGKRFGPTWLFWMSVAGLLTYGVYLTDSRGALLGLLLVLGVYVWQTRGVFVAGALGSMAVGVLLALPSRFQEIDASEASAQGRVESWYEGLMMFRGHPLFGVGPDMYSDIYHLTAHNSYVLVLAETGIVGFTLWLAFVVYGFRMMWAVWRDPPAWDDDDALACAAPAGPAAQSATSMPAGQAGTVHAPATQPAVEVDADDDEAEIEDDAEGRNMGLALLLSLVGCYTTAFFLSRSYLVVLYLLAALIVAHYLQMRRGAPWLPDFSLGRDALLWPAVSVGSVIFLYIMVKVLLALQ